MNTALLKPDTVDLRGNFSRGPSNTVIFVKDGKRVFLDLRLIVLHQDGTITLPRRMAKEKGLI